MCPPPSANLNIVAEFPNGTLIGTTFCDNGYVQHTPGMWLTVAPNGQAPFTGSFTGRSMLPFTLFNFRAYTIQMTLSYSNIYFDHWQDNNNTNPQRTVTLNGGATYTAIYVQRGTAPVMPLHQGPGTTC